jgi:hypothetical protein
VSDAEIALSAVAGACPGCCGYASGTRPRHRGHLDQLAKAELRLLGVPADEASSPSLPDTGAW